MSASQTILLLVIAVALCAAPTFASLPRKECTIMKNPMPIPPVGVVCANPERAQLIATKYLDYYFIHTDFRGYRVYVGEYKGAPLFVSYIGLGSASAAFMTEELVSYDAKVIVRLGTNDYNTTDKDVNKLYVVQQCYGLAGLMQDYGYPSDQWGKGLNADSSLVSSIIQTSTHPEFVNLTVLPSRGYNIDAFYAFFDPSNVARAPDTVKQLIYKYQNVYNCTVRDMETCAVYLVGEMRGVKTASVLQAVVKHTSKHEDAGTTGIMLVLETLRVEHNMLMKKQTKHEQEEMAKKIEMIRSFRRTMQQLI